MNNQLLDLILDRLSNKHQGVMLHTQPFLDENPEIRDSSGCWDAIKYLNDKGYVLRQGILFPGEKIMILPDGKLKINNGGFCGEADYLQETLKVAKESRDYAKKAVTWTIILGILGILTTIAISLL